MWIEWAFFCGCLSLFSNTVKLIHSSVCQRGSHRLTHVSLLTQRVNGHRAWLSALRHKWGNNKKAAVRKKRFVVYKHDRSAVLFLWYLLLEQENIFLKIISMFCVFGWTGIPKIGCHIEHLFWKRVKEKSCLFAKYQFGHANNILIYLNMDNLLLPIIDNK